MYTVYQEIFVLKIFHVLNFRVKKFSWSGLDHEIFQDVKMAMYEYQLQWCVRGVLPHLQGRVGAAVGEELECEREKTNAQRTHVLWQLSARMSLSAIYCERSLKSAPSS